MAGEQPVDIMFSAGFDSKTDPKAMQPGQLVDARNCYQDKTGSIIKRPGSISVKNRIRYNTTHLNWQGLIKPFALFPFGEKLLAGGSIVSVSGNANRVYMNGEGLVGLSTGNLDLDSVYRENHAPWAFMSSGLFPCSISYKKIGPCFGLSGAANVPVYSYAICGDLVIIASNNGTSYNTYITVYDRKSGIEITRSHKLFMGGAAIRGFTITPFKSTVGSPSNDWIFVSYASGGTLYFGAYAATSVTDVISAIETLESTGVGYSMAAAGDYYAICTTDDSFIWIATVTGATQITLTKTDYSCAALATANYATGGVLTTELGLDVSTTVDGSAADKILQWVNVNGPILSGCMRPFNGTTPVGSQRTWLAGGSAAITGLCSCDEPAFWADGYLGTQAKNMRMFGRQGYDVRSSLVSASLPTPIIRVSANILTRPALRKDRALVLLSHNDSVSSQPTYFLSQSPVQRFTDINTVPIDDKNCLLARFNYLAAPTEVCSGYQSPLPQINVDEEDKRYSFVIVDESSGSPCFVLVELDFSLRQLPSAELGGSLYIGGPVLKKFDGRLFDNGFQTFPVISGAATAYTSGGSIADGTYYYKLVYEFIDGKGELHRSAPSAAAAVTIAGGGGSGRFVVNVAQEYVGDFCRFNSAETPSAVVVRVFRTALGGSVYYDTGAYSFIDAATTVSVTESDATIQANAALYTEVELEQQAPSGAKCLCAHNNRLLAVPIDDPTAIWVSKEYAYGYTVEFCSSFVVRVQDPIEAVFGLDQLWIAASNKSIRYFTGPGPNAAGSDSWFGPVMTISTNRGVKNWRSVAQIPLGIAFQSNVGWCLLDRGLNVTDLNAPAKYRDYEVLNTVVDDRRSLVLWHLSNGEAIVWDFSRNAWFIWDGMDVNAIAVWQNKIVGLKDNGLMRIESGFKDDEQNPISLGIETGWISMSGKTGAQHVSEISIVGKWKSAHILKAHLSYDYDDTVSETVEIDLDSDPGLYLMQITPGKQKCTAFKIKIEDVPTGGSGESCELVGLRLMVSGMSKPVRPVGAE